VSALRWGILGCGAIATSAIAPAIRWARDAELVAVGSRTMDRARQKAAEVGAARAHGRYEDLLADPEVDAVYIGLPNGEHAQWAIAAAEAGKHVLCDKSLTLHVDDAHAMREAFARRGLVLVEGFMVRHHPQWSALRDLLASGAIGGVQHLRAWFRARLSNDADHRWSPELGGGALFDVTCYPINLVRFVTREEPAAAQATGLFTASGVDAETDALLEMPSGIVASVHGSLRAPFEQGLVVAGERGRLILERPFVPGWEPTSILVDVDGSMERRDVSGANHFLHMIEHVTSHIRDRSTPLAPAEDGVANVEACNLVLAAARAHART